MATNCWAGHGYAVFRPEFEFIPDGFLSAESQSLERVELIPRKFSCKLHGVFIGNSLEALPGRRRGNIGHCGQREPGYHCQRTCEADHGEASYGKGEHPANLLIET